MAKSHTRKKFDKRVTPSVAQELNQVTDYIKRWTNRELGKLQEQSETPICVPTNTGYRIGLYRLHVHPNKTTDVYNHNSEFVHRFESKISAILFTIYTIKRKYAAADEILVCDREINKCYTDMLNLRRTVEQARQRKDYVTVDTRMPRLEMAETRLNLARERISKLHKTGKYNKVWE
ncbi:hypothetical protein UFOVP112_265 [uncultured Caudovirales phage]|uniref:Uncharacterized protein n=1 Tax=uncultured Caudovirales phage TaxID=2100421 RepID=A0A6J5L7Z7_9CAUD|nr:hypothetical protein UFOVP112_265 [uncultured Caudovirales phage]